MKTHNKFKEFNEAAEFMRSLKMTYAEIRTLKNDTELEFILSRAKELRIPNIKEYISFVKNNKNINK